jgi:hypothetical protein
MHGKQWMMSAVLSLIVASTSFASEQTHYVNGVEGIKGASLPPPGVYGRLYSAYYTADTLRDANGDKLPVGFDASVLAFVPRLIWITPYKILGADYGMDVLAPYLSKDIEIDAMGLSTDSAGFGDIAVEPILLSWHFARADVSAAAGAYLKTGDFDSKDPSSPGDGYDSLLFTLGSTLYLDPAKTWAASLLSRYEVNGNKDDVDIRPGDAFHFEWGLSKNVAKLYEVGLAGYCHWQVTDDSGDDVPAAGKGDHDRTFAIGPEIQAMIPQIMTIASLRYEKEFEVRDRPEGQIAVLTLTKIF